MNYNDESFINRTFSFQNAKVISDIFELQRSLGTYANPKKFILNELGQQL